MCCRAKRRRSAVKSGYLSCTRNQICAVMQTSLFILRYEDSEVETANLYAFSHLRFLPLDMHRFGCGVCVCVRTRVSV